MYTKASSDSFVTLECVFGASEYLFHVLSTADLKPQMRENARLRLGPTFSKHTPSEQDADNGENNCWSSGRLWQHHSRIVLLLTLFIRLYIGHDQFVCMNIIKQSKCCGVPSLASIIVWPITAVRHWRLVMTPYYSYHTIVHLFHPITSQSNQTIASPHLSARHIYEYASTRGKMQLRLYDILASCPNPHIQKFRHKVVNQRGIQIGHLERMRQDETTHGLSWPIRLCAYEESGSWRATTIRALVRFLSLLGIGDKLLGLLSWRQLRKKAFVAWCIPLSVRRQPTSANTIRAAQILIR